MTHGLRLMSAKHVWIVNGAIYRWFSNFHNGTDKKDNLKGSNVQCTHHLGISQHIKYLIMNLLLSSLVFQTFSMDGYIVLYSVHSGPRVARNGISNPLFILHGFRLTVNSQHFWISQSLRQSNGRRETKINFNDHRTTNTSHPLENSERDNFCNHCTAKFPFWVTDEHRDSHIARNVNT